MIKLVKYLKPYVIPIIISFILMIGQVMCGLSLPELTSKVVDVGILKNGIESVSPEMISIKSMEIMKMFMDEKEKSTVDKYYLKDNDRFIRLKEFDEELLNGIFGKSINVMKTYLNETHKDEEIYNISTLNKYMNEFVNIPKERLDKIREKIENKDSLELYQDGVPLIKKFYEEIDVDLGKIETVYIIRMGLNMLGLTVIIIILTILSNFISSKVTSGLSRDLRKDVFRKIESFSNEEYDQFSSSSLITRTTNDVSQVQSMLLEGIGTIFSAPIYGVLGIVYALKKSISMSWSIAAGILIISIFLVISFILVMPKFKIMQQLIDKFNLVVRENLSGIMVVRAFGNQDEEERKFRSINDKLTDINRYIFKVTVSLQPFMTISMSVLHITMIWIAAKQINSFKMEVGDLLAFLQYGSLVISSFMMLATMFMSLPRAEISANRLREILETEPKIIDLPDPIEMKDIKGKIEFKNVSFKYRNAKENVINNISFEASPGEVTAIIGATGSGKSTIANLIPRFYEVKSGEILIDGVDIKTIGQKELRNNIGYVPQNSILFSGDIESNIKYGNNDISEEEMKNIIDISQVNDFISNDKEGIHLKISQGGRNISGGQRQRVAIARALSKNAPIYIFDDCFSALDFKTDLKIRRGIRKKLKKSTILIIAQRISTIINSDKIIVLRNGKIVGIGKHNELLKVCQEYKEIALSQFSEGELLV